MTMISKTFKHWPWFVLLTATLTACSFKNMYNQLDYLIPQYVEDMVTLDDVLAQQLDERTHYLLDWHRNTQLPQYADWFTQMQQDVLAQPTEQQVSAHLKRLDQFWTALSEKINDHMAQLLPKLNARQREQLFESLGEKNQEFREEFVDIDADEREGQYVERLRKNYERWLDDLNDAQEDAIEQAAQQLVSTADLRLQRRIDWQQGIRRILELGGDADGKSHQLRAFMKKFESLDSEAMRTASQHNQQVIAKLTVNMAAAMDKAQKKYFVARSNAYIDDFRELKAEAQPSETKHCCA